MPANREIGIVELVQSFKATELEKLKRFLAFMFGERMAAELSPEVDRLWSRDPVPGPTDASRRYRLHTKLRKAIYDYLTLVSLEKSPLAKYPHLIKELNYRDARTEGARVLNRYKRSFENLTFRPPAYFFHHSQFEYHRLIHQNGNFVHQKIPRLVEIQTAKERQTMLERIHLLCLEVSASRLFDGQFKRAELEGWKEKIEGDPELLTIHSFRLYYFLLESFLTPREAIPGMGEAVEAFLECYHEFPSHTYFELYTMFLNHYLLLSSKGLERPHLCALYWLGVRKGILLVKDKRELPVPHALNLFFVTLSVKGIDGTRELLEEMMGYLGALNRETAGAFFKAVLAFREGKYGLARRLLPDNVGDVYLELHRRLTFVAIAWEAEEEVEYILGLVHKDRMWVSRQELFSETSRRYYINCLNWLGRLVRSSEEPTVEMLAELEGMRRTPFQEWIGFQYQKARSAGQLGAT